MSQEEEVVEETIAEEPQEEVSELSTSRIVEIPLSASAPQETAVAKPKPKARGKRGPDKKQRAKPKPKARAVVVQPVEEESSEEESADEATLDEIRSLNLLRSIRSYESQRHSRKNQLYASWFGR